MYTSSIILALLTALSMAAPAPSEDFALVPRAQKIPDKVKAPKEGQCLLVVFSSTVLPIGGAPTTVNGAGIAPSLVGEEQAAVINHNKARDPAIFNAVYQLTGAGHHRRPCQFGAHESWVSS